jgi:hypothetical protein
MKRLLLVPYTFVLLNWAAMRALYCFLRAGGLDHLWDSSADHTRADLPIATIGSRPLRSTPGR